MTTNGTPFDDLAAELSTKRVVITGAAGVVGGWIADAFAGCGSRLLLSDAREDRLKTMVGSGRWSGAAEVQTHGCDLTETESIAGLVERIADLFAAPDVVVNNAGIYPHGPLLEFGTDEWRQVMDVNLTAPFVLIRDTARLMVDGGVEGAFVNIASGASVTVAPGGVAYSVSKAAVAMLTRGAALELAPHRIRVNAVGPGFAPGSEVSELDDDYVQRMLSRIPLGRSANPTDASSMVLYLSSSRASFITGALFHIDGGRVAAAAV